MNFDFLPKRLFVALLILCLSSLGYAQVKDIGISFSKVGYIQSIAADKKSMIVNYIEPGQIKDEVLSLDDKVQVTIDEQPSPIKQLHTGMKVTVAGEYFQTQKASSARKITATTHAQQDLVIEGGRIDVISGKYAYVDGNKIKLANGSIITGEKGNGYEGKEFTSFAQLKLGDFINVKGYYSPKGYVIAKAVTVAPETVTDDDRKMMAKLDDFQNAYYDTWTDPKQRTKMFGMCVGRGANIVSDTGLQNYVNSIGFSMIPVHMRSKLRFMFIVVDDMSWNASMMPNGVCLVNLGLLFGVTNEAQLATVLGHEISHAIYEHTVLRQENEVKANEKAQKRERIAGNVKSLVNKLQPHITVTNGNGRTSVKTLNTKTTDLLIKDLPNARDKKKLSDYSVEEELQADRVGLTLMALAGYDVREAPLIWREMYNTDNRNAAPAEKKGAATDSEHPLNKQGDLLDLGADYMNYSLQKKATRLGNASHKTHPDEVKRFEELNKLIDQYYSDSATIASSRTEAGRYAKVVYGYYLVCRAKALKIKEQEANDKKKRPEYDKQLTKVVPQKRERLSTITKPILVYKDYPLRPIVNLNELINKSCPDRINESVTQMQKYYDHFANQVSEFVRKFKNGDVAPHEKDRQFTFLYLLSRDVNETSVKFAAAASIGDYKTVAENTLTPDDFNAIINKIYDSHEFREVIEYLKAKNE